MATKIVRLSIRDVGPLRSLVLEPAQLTVIHGSNEAGKTSCIDALVRALRGRLRPGNQTLVAGLRDGPGFAGDVELDLAPEDGGALLALLREHPSLTRLFVVRDGDASFEKGRWLDALRGRLSGVDLRRVEKAVRNAASLTESGSVQKSRGEEIRALRGRRDRFDAFLADLPAIDALSAEIAALEFERASERTRLEGFRAAERWEHYRIARDALAEERRAGGQATELVRYSPSDRDAWEEAIGSVRTTGAVTSRAAEQVQGLRDQLRGDSEELRRREAILEQASARAGACARLELPAKVERALDVRRAVRGWAMWRTPLAVAGTLLLALTGGIALRTTAVVAPVGIPLSLIAGAAGALGLLASGLVIFATRRLRAARDLEEETLTAAGKILLRGETLEACAAQLAAIDGRLKLAESERSNAAGRKRDTEASLEAAETEHRTREAERDEAQRRVAEVRNRVGLTSLEQLREKLLARTEAESALRQARRTLASLLGERSDYAPAVERLAVEDPGIESDPAELARLQERIEVLEASLARSRGDLVERRDRALAGLGVPDLSAAEAERDRLAAAVEQAEREVVAAKLCLDTLRELARDVDLPLRDALGVGPGAAGEVLARLTDGRYTAVIAETSGDLTVERGDGVRLPSADLSRGVRDQLALAVRLALVRRLVGEPAFLVLDDAFASSDPARREALARAASDLTGEGWQILYFTFDPALRDRFAALGARVVELPAREPISRLTPAAREVS